MPEESGSQPDHPDDNVLAWIIGIAFAVFALVIVAAIISSSGGSSASNAANNVALDADNAANALLDEANELLDHPPPEPPAR
jgi:hypothetical protein